MKAFVDLHCHTSASFDSLASPESVVKAAATRGLTHLAITDHDRIEGALRARDAAPAGPHDHHRRGDQDRRRRPDRAVPRARRRARAARARHDRRGPRAGRPGRDPAPVRPFPGLDAQGPAAGGDGAARRLGRVPQRPRRRRVGQRAGRRVRARDGPARRSPCPTPTASSRSASPTPSLDGNPSTAEGLMAALTNVSLVPGRASYIVRTLTPIAKLVNRARGNRRVDRQPVRRHGCQLMSEPPVPDADATDPSIPDQPAARGAGSTRAPRAGRRRRRRRRPGDDGGQISLGAPAAPAADDHLARHPAGPAGPDLPGRAQRRLRGAREQRRQREQAAPARRVPRVLRRLPDPRPALGAPAEGRRHARRDQGRDRDPVPVVDRELPGPGQARRPVPRVPAQDQRRRVAAPAPWARSSSSGSSTCSRSRSWASLAGFWSFRTGFPPEIQFVAVLGIGVIVVLAGFLLARAQLRPRDPRQAPASRTRRSSSTTGSRRACSRSTGGRSGRSSILTVLIWAPRACASGW